MEVQANLPHVGKGAEADTGSYKYQYATLADVNGALLPVLGKAGLVWTCGPEWSDGGWALHGRLSDGTDTLDAWWPLPKTDDPQRLGSAVTYGRRYLLCALVGLVPDEDDDGQKAARPEPAAGHVAAMRTIRGHITAMFVACGKDSEHDAYKNMWRAIRAVGISDAKKDDQFAAVPADVLEGLAADLGDLVAAQEGAQS